MRARTLTLVTAAALWLAAASGCSSNPSTPMPDMGGMGDVASGPDGMTYPPNYDTQNRCYNDPTTHVQIINSCPQNGVTVDRIDKNPTLPLLNADGSRPPLP
jgi:hypothetical protein